MQKHVNINITPLRDDPRFEALLTQYNHLFTINN